jgi:FdhD protein
MTRLPGDDRKGGGEPTVLRYDGRRLVPVAHTPIQELCVALSVNGAPYATLVASPHDLHFLVAGFLRLQGVIRTPADLLTLTVFEQQGSVSVRLQGETPQPPASASARPVLLPRIASGRKNGPDPGSSTGRADAEAGGCGVSP